MLGLLGLKLLRVRIRQLRATATKKSWTSSTLYVQATISSTIDLNPIAFGISSSRLLSWLITLNWGLTQCPTSQQCDHVFGGNTPLAPVGGPICSKMVLGGGWVQGLLHNDVFEKWIWVSHVIYGSLNLHWTHGQPLNWWMVSWWTHYMHENQ